MNKLKMMSRNRVEKNIEDITKLFPECLTERMNENEEVEYGIDFEVLKQELSEVIVADNEETYKFTWPGKRKSILLANKSTTNTFRPDKNTSESFENTENLYIEGDNLEALKLLQEPYLGKVKVIYIDPPYNTGKDFIYEDDFSKDRNEFLEESGQYDNEGNRLVKNLETNGRFHTDWLNMIYPRLKLAKNLLAEDGVIFMSIDDNEQGNLKKVADLVFGEGNFIAQVIWERAFSPVNLKKHFSESHDYVICYAKNINAAVCKGLSRNLESDNRYSNPDNDERGPWTSGDLSVGPVVESKVYEITTPGGRKVLPPDGYCWRLDKEKFQQYVNDNRIWFGEVGNNVPRIKRFLSEVKQGITPMTVWKFNDVGHSQEAKQYLKKLFDGKAYFDYPKPVKLIKRLIELYASDDCIVMDFFSGSATTAEAVMELNFSDKGKRKFIMVQLPEGISEKNQSYKDGYVNVCEIGKERIRRAGKKLKGENGLLVDNLDIGFRVLKIDSTNMKDVYYNPVDYQVKMLDDLINNIKEDRTSEDLLFQVMLDLGILLSSKIEEEVIKGKKVFNIDNGFLIACFDEDITDEIIETIAKKKPYYFVMRDSSLIDDSMATNFEQIFNDNSPETIRKVL